MVSSSFLAGVINRPTFSGGQDPKSDQSDSYSFKMQAIYNVCMQPKEYNNIPGHEVAYLDSPLINNMHIIQPPITGTKRLSHSQILDIAVDP